MKPRILFFLSVSMMLLVLTALFLYIMSNPEKFRYGPVLWAEKLSTKPERFMVLTDPDPYVVEALSNPGSLVFVGYWDNTNIDELIETHRYRTNNVEYSQTYYTITMGTLDPLYGSFFLILIFSWIGLGVSFVVTQLRARSSRSPVGAHTIAEALEGGCFRSAGLLRHEAFLRFGYDPDAAFSENVDERGFGE